MGVIIKILK